MTLDIVWQVWSKGIVIGANDPVLWRKDEYGAWILRSHYGNRDSEYGWEIGYITPVSEGVQMNFQTCVRYIGKIPC